MVIVQHYPHSAKHYAEASPSPGVLFPIPETCPACGAVNLLIRWGFYERWACTIFTDYRIRVQRVRCKACGRTHSLLPDFLHPYRHYVISLLQCIVSLYLLANVSIEGLMEHLMGQGPVRSTVREWISAFAYGAGMLLIDWLRRQLATFSPLSELPETPPPDHLERVPDATKQRRLAKAHRFWCLAEQIYAQAKARLPRLHFATEQVLAFVLHWLQNQAVTPRIFWSPRLATTPTEPF
jgi:hypothetical protein